MSDDKVEAHLAKLDELKEYFENIEGLGKDLILRIQDVLDGAKAEVRASFAVGGHDVNDDLVAAAGSPEDHPREQGAEHPSVADQKSPELEVSEGEKVNLQNPERRTGDAGTPEPELPASDPVQGKDHLETEQLDASKGETPAGVQPDVKPV